MGKGHPSSVVTAVPHFGRPDPLLLVRALTRMSTPQQVRVKVRFLKEDLLSSGLEMGDQPLVVSWYMWDLET